MPAVVAAVKDVRAKLGEVLGRLEAMDSSPEVCTVMISGLVEIRSTLEVGQLENRIAALEKLLANKPDPSLPIPAKDTSVSPLHMPAAGSAK
jgi:hypothetical protein